MSGSADLQLEVDALAAAAEAVPDATADLKALAVQLWANFDEFSIEELEQILRSAWRLRGLPFNDNAGN
jgi:hypothetical protein